MKLQLHKHVNLLAGFFVASALIVFGVGTFVLLYKNGMFNLRYTLNATFDSGLGLRQGTDVQYNGVKIGRVEAVELVPVATDSKRAGRVLLRLRIDRRYQEFLTQHSVAYAERDKNLVSDRVVNIETPRRGGFALADGDTVRVTDSRDIETLIGGITRLMGKMDDLLNNIGEVVRMSRDTASTVGAMLGSRVLYDQFLLGIAHTDTAVREGRRVLSRVDRLGDTLHSHLGTLLARADTTSGSLQRTAQEAERLGVKANALADQGDVLLRRVDQILLEGSGKLDQAGDLMDAVSRLWFIRSKLEPPKEFPVLLNTAGP
jgi:phospholipid/cholesterol/gamma-HCH transport system substrate-binding protein